MPTFNPELHAQTLNSERAYFVQPDADPAFTPHIGALVEMLTYARLTTLQAVEGLPEDQLWATAPGFATSQPCSPHSHSTCCSSVWLMTMGNGGCGGNENVTYS